MAAFSSSLALLLLVFLFLSLPPPLLGGSLLIVASWRNSAAYRLARPVQQQLWVTSSSSTSKSTGRRSSSSSRSSLYLNPVSITFSNFPCDDLPNGKGSMTFKISSDAALGKLLSDIGAIAVKEESTNGSGDFVASPSLDVLKEAVPYRLVFKPRFETAIGRIENGIKNAATAFEHKANLALMDELTLLGRAEVVLAIEGGSIMRANGEAAAEIDGLVFAASAATCAAAPDDAYVVEAKMYAKVEDLAAVERKMRILMHPPADALNPVNLSGRALTGVLATIDTTSDVIAAAKAVGVWVLVQNGSGFNLITHS